jgi:LmbE family N-acetylglucosaminyl deacetylase
MATSLLLALAILAADPVPRTPHGSAGGTVSGLDLMDVDLMFVGAHPDDDTGIMGTFARYLLDEGFRGTVVTLTGGEGGGNATGPEAGMALGLIRREEERRALESLGVASPRFLGLTDFYFTLSAEETEARWGRAFLCDVVREVRLRRPEVIVTMWPGPGTHGQHQMAARAATLAYTGAGEVDVCPDQLKAEGLKPFAPAKLYYYDRPDAPDTIAVRTDDVSPSARLRYADLRSLAVMHYKSQGYDTPQNVPAREARPESFLLVASRVPVSRPESHLLEGALLPAGNSPPGIGLAVTPSSFEAAVGAATRIDVRLHNGSGAPLEDVRVQVEAPASWTVEGPAATAVRLEPGAELVGAFSLRPGSGASLDRNTRVTARYTARRGDTVAAGSNSTWMRPVPALAARVEPLHDVAGYRAFAAQTRTEWVIETLPTRIAAPVGEQVPVALRLTNRGDQPARGDVAFELPVGVALDRPATFEVAPGATATVTAHLRADVGSRAADRQTARLPISITVPGGGRDTAELYVLPTGTAPRLAKPPVVDGDLDDLPAPTVSIGPADRWWRKAPDSPADLSAEARLGWDAENLYVGVRVRDETVVCNIAPDDVKSQLRSDAVGITVDPSGGSRDTSTTLQFAAFPCTTAGWGARGFRDADQRPGLIEETAPGAKVASKRTDDGYTLEVALPWSALPSRPRPGATIGLNVVLYDGDQKDARPGANISETGLAWAAFEWGGKQALPWLWPRVTLAR